MKTAIVLGSGIQGVCSSFALSKAGYDVTIVERDPNVFSRTSQNQEGRIHMGFTYALDRSGVTGSVVMNSALTFSSIFEEWFGEIDWEEYLLPQGYYALHKSLSLLTDEEVIDYYTSLEQVYTRYLDENPSYSYFGKRPRSIFTVLSKIPDNIDSKNVSTVIYTDEQLVEMFYFRKLIEAGLESFNIQTLLRTEALKVERVSPGFVVRVCQNDTSHIQLKADIVVNCLWNNRRTFDFESFGIESNEEALHRFKYGILGTVTDEVPNVTFAAGAFGNVSPRFDGSHAYISWHPLCMRELTTDGTTPKQWEESFHADQAELLQQPWVNQSKEILQEYVPSLRTFKPYKLLPGIICSRGKTDIHDKDSYVHKRGNHMGVHSYDGYYSIDTGKFSSAPLFAKELVLRIREDGL